MRIGNEIQIIREVLNLSQEELACELKVTFETINRWETDKSELDDANVEKIYNYAFKKGIHFNRVYEQLLFEQYGIEPSKLLFHGSKSKINFPIDLSHSKLTNDFGIAFYLGEKFEQAAMYIANSKYSTVYAFKFDMNKMNSIKFDVNSEWMLAIAYYRGWLYGYKKHPLIANIINKIKDKDLIIAPIADNKMFDIISEFIRGEITDLQCEHALAATNLGYQYVIRTKKGLSNLSLLKELYVPTLEKEELYSKRIEMGLLSQSKVRAARIEFKGNGQYIEELLK